VYVARASRGLYRNWGIEGNEKLVCAEGWESHYTIGHFRHLAEVPLENSVKREEQKGLVNKRVYYNKMRGIVLVLVTVCVVLCSAEHDHSLHIDPKFIHGEALRVAWLSKSEIIENLSEYKDALGHLHSVYDELVLNPPEHTKDEPLDESWIDNYQANYRKAFDYLLVASHICQDIYSDEQCNLPIGLWRNTCDGRGDKFVNDFVLEIHNAIKGIVADVKDVRGQIERASSEI
jgi:hypothetical protein